MSLGPMPPTYERRDVGPRHESPLTRTLFLVVGVVVVVAVAVFAFAGSALQDAFLDDAVEAPVSETVEVGEAFTVGDVSADDGWSLGADAEGNTEVRDLVLTNDSDERVQLEATLFLLDGDRPLATFGCATTGAVAPGGSAAARCIGPDTDVADEVDGVVVQDAGGS